MFYTSWIQLISSREYYIDKMNKKFNDDVYYEFEGHFFLGHYEEHKTRPFRASKKTTTLDNKLDSTGEKIKVPAELFALYDGKWEKHPTVFLTKDQYEDTYINVLLAAGGHLLQSYRPTNPSMTEFYEEAERLGLTRGSL